MIFHLSDEDEISDGSVAVLDSESPGPSSESDTLEFGAAFDQPASDLDAESDVDHSSGPQWRDRLEAEPDHRVALDDQGEAEPGDAGLGRSREKPPAARGREPRRSRRAVAFGALGALVVLMVMIVLQPGRSASGVSSRLPTSTQGPMPARGDPIARAPLVAGHVHRPASVRHRKHGRLAPSSLAHHRRHAPITSSSSLGISRQPAPIAAAVSRAATTPIPVPAPESPPSRPVQPRSPSQGYAEFSFER